jgi:hypothetical protein
MLQPLCSEKPHPHLSLEEKLHPLYKEKLLFSLQKQQLVSTRKTETAYQDELKPSGKRK